MIFASAVGKIWRDAPRVLRIEAKAPHKISKVYNKKYSIM
jgi:hypothetical protein